jgi:hypothetical protein
MSMVTFAQRRSDLREGYYIKYKAAHVSIFEAPDGQLIESLDKDEPVGMNEVGNYLCVFAKLDILGNMSFRFIEIDEGGTAVDQGGPFYDGKTVLGPVSGFMRQVTARIANTDEGLLITEEVVVFMDDRDNGKPSYHRFKLKSYYKYIGYPETSK